MLDSKEWEIDFFLANFLFSTLLGFHAATITGQSGKLMAGRRFVIEFWLASRVRMERKAIAGPTILVPPPLLFLPLLLLLLLGEQV